MLIERCGVSNIGNAPSTVATLMNLTATSNLSGSRVLKHSKEAVLLIMIHLLDER